MFYFADIYEDGKFIKRIHDELYLQVYMSMLRENDPLASINAFTIRR